MKIIKVSPNYEAFVDDSLYDFINSIKWYISKHGYAISGNIKQNRIKTFTKMHHLVFKAGKGLLVDHIDGNKLNNQRSNLRAATLEQNVHNQKKRTNTKTKYKGVHYKESSGFYTARCRMNHQDFFLGNFLSQEAAAYAYNRKAMELSEFALLNTIELSNEELEKLLITSKVKQRVAYKKSEYRFIYWKKLSKLNDFHGTWSILIQNENSRTYKAGFKTDKQAHDYLVSNYLTLINGKSLLRKR